LNLAGSKSLRALVLAPNGRDAPLTVTLLKDAGFTADICADLPALVGEMERGAGMVIIADEALQASDMRPLIRFLQAQPPWSDMPIILLTHRGGGPERNPAALRLGDLLGNVSFLERPFHPTTLSSMVHSASRGRRRQYEARQRLVLRGSAADRAHGRPARLVDNGCRAHHVPRLGDVPQPFRRRRRLEYFP
jgi:DNA-binding response OmpR family regulator